MFIPLGKSLTNDLQSPGADTRGITQQIHAAINEVKPSLSAGIRIESLYAQEHFIDRAIENVMVALRDGGFLVSVILFLFLMNFRTTLISLTAIPLSLLMSVLVFYWFNLSINTMTLGGLAVAIGELVDDAIVDVENIFRRLKENAQLVQPKSPLRVVCAASLEVAIAAWAVSRLDRDFLPTFIEGAIQLNVLLPPGNSLTTSIAINKTVEQSLISNSDILIFVRRTSRAELDEHAEPVTDSEYIIGLDPRSKRTRDEQLDLIRENLD